MEAQAIQVAGFAWYWLALAAVGSAALGFGGGVWYSVNNPGDAAKFINNVAAEIQRDQKALDQKKTDALAAAQALAAKIQGK
jgi:hypothetical protein